MPKLDARSEKGMIQQIVCCRIGKTSFVRSANLLIASRYLCLYEAASCIGMLQHRTKCAEATRTTDEALREASRGSWTRDS